MSRDLNGIVTWLKDWFYDKTEVDNLISQSSGGAKSEFYGTCSTAQGTQNKVITVSSGTWSWTAGNTIKVKFSNANTYSTPRISIGGTVKNIVVRGTTTGSSYAWKAGEVIEFIYDGTYMVMLGLANVLDIVYPVGAIYMSVNSTSPATLFGGSWTQIKDTFLLACGTKYASDGAVSEAKHGSANAVVVSHSHTVNNGGGGSTSDHTHNHGESFPIYNAGSAVSTKSNAVNWTNHGTTQHAINNATHSHTIPNHTHDCSTEGESGTDKNMPPYMAVYMWRRTA